MEHDFWPLGFPFFSGFPDVPRTKLKRGTWPVLGGTMEGGLKVCLVKEPVKLGLVPLASLKDSFARPRRQASSQDCLQNV